MKTIKLILALFIVFCCFSCKQNETEMKGGVVPYAPCSCEKDETYPTIEYAILFNDSIPAQYGWEIWQEFIQDDDDKKINWIIYDSQTDRAYVYMGHYNSFILAIGDICNYPDFAKKWNIPLNGGRLVYFEGTRHSPCVPKYGLATIGYFDIILTILKLE